MPSTRTGPCKSLRSGGEIIGSHGIELDRIVIQFIGTKQRISKAEVGFWTEKSWFWNRTWMHLSLELTMVAAWEVNSEKLRSLCTRMYPQTCFIWRIVETPVGFLAMTLGSMGKGCHVHGLGVLMCPWKLPLIYPSLSMEDYGHIQVGHDPSAMEPDFRMDQCNFSTRFDCVLWLSIASFWARQTQSMKLQDILEFCRSGDKSEIVSSNSVWSQRYWNVLADLWQSVHISACWNHGTCCVFFWGLASLVYKDIDMILKFY